MKVGIIGAGQIGGTLTRRLTDLGHGVIVANSRGPDTLSGLAAKTGATAVSASEAVHGVDLVIVTIPEALAWRRSTSSTRKAKAQLSQT